LVPGTKSDMIMASVLVERRDSLSGKNIVLIGMPGCGKSTIGVLLAKALCMDFVDTDLIIQNKTGKTLQRIIEDDGLAKFLAVENEVLVNLKCDNTVIASGGSSVLSPAGILHLREIGTTVYLEISYQTMVGRISNVETRGLVLQTDEKLIDLYEMRVPLYEKYADIKINCNGFSAQECVGLVQVALNRASCAEKFFAAKPDALVLYQKIENAILNLAKATVDFQKSQISFGCKRKFAWVWLPVRKVKNRPDLYVILSLSLERRLDSRRIVEVIESYPGCWMHHLMISRPDDLDDELLGWIGEAIDVARS